MDGEQPASAAGAARTPEDGEERRDIEAVARCVYEAMRVAASPYVETPRWTEGGNSTRQDEARRAAARIVALVKRRNAPAAMTTPTTAEQVNAVVREFGQGQMVDVLDIDNVRFIAKSTVQTLVHNMAQEILSARATIARLEALVSTAYEEGWRTGTFDASRTDADNDSECRSDWLVSFTRRVLATVKEAKP